MPHPQPASPHEPPSQEPPAQSSVPTLDVLIIGDGPVADEAELELASALTTAYRLSRARRPGDVDSALVTRGRLALILVYAREPAVVVTDLVAGLPHPPRILVLTDRAVHDDLAGLVDADLLAGVVAVPWTPGRLAVQAVAQIARWLHPEAPAARESSPSEHESRLLQLFSVPMPEATAELVTAVERVLGPRPRLVLPTGTRVTREEVSVDGLLIVLRGEVALGVDSGSGDEIRLHHASTGPLIGLPALAERRKAFVTARATTEVELVHLTVEQLDQALAADPRVGAVMTAVSMRSLSTRLRRAEILQVEKTRLNETLARERARLAQALKALSEARLELVAQARSATIGDMAAGIAHELNSPLAALTRAIEHADSDIRTLLAALPHGDVVEEVITAAYTRPTLSARAERALRRELERSGVPSHRSRALVAAGLGEATEATRIAQAGLDDELVDAAAGLGAALRNARLAQGHISALVQGLRSAMRPDALEAILTSVPDTIEDALRLSAHRLNGVDVVRDYGEVDPILAHPGQLTQVWTNLITNAADALSGQGELTVSVHRHGRGVRVEVCDTGPGIPPQLQERIFEPRFTTKAGAVRFGLGLGLGISRRIVTDHGGTIVVRSQPTQTVFTVELPARPPQEQGESR